MRKKVKGVDYMKYEEEVSKMCMQAIKYKKYAEARQCEKCCLYCQNRCDEVCEKAKEVEGSCTNTQ